MATNKHATIRYQALDKCFRNPGRKYFIDDLVEACNIALADFDFKGDGIKRRQLYDDISFMESERGWSIPLDKIKDGKKVFYRYSDLKFSINSQPINETEANQLKETLLLLSRFKGMPQFEWINEIIVRFETAFKLKNTEEKVIDFDQNQYLKGLEFFPDLFNAIIYKKPLSIQYQGFKQKKEFKCIVHSYFLKQYNNRWYIFGYDSEQKTLLNLAIDRIISITDAKSKFIENTLFDFNDYFEDIVGVTLPENASTQRIIIKVKKGLWPYLSTKPLHGSQKVAKKEGDFIIIELNVIVNFELIALLFSHGGGLTVIEPLSLSESLQNRAKSLLQNYL